MPRKLPEMLRKRFGKLVVLKRLENNERGRDVWLCECDCGTIKPVTGYDLRCGNTLSCGCYHKFITSTPYVDLSNKKFGHLTPISVNDKTLCRGKRIWKCSCDCGNICYVKEGTLIYKDNPSCGCVKVARMKRLGRSLKRYNTYDLSHEEYAIGYTLKNEPFLFDKEDYAKIKDICWYYGYGGYIKGNINGKSINLHRLVTDVLNNNDVVVDHINHDVKDNRKCNLRVTDQMHNARNVSVRSDNTSGYTGVTWDKQHKKWASQIVVEGKNIHLGRFDNVDDAVIARKEAEDKYYGEYSYDASMVLGKET